MAATITDSFRDKLIKGIFDDYKSLGRAQGDSDYFYIGIGKSENYPNDSDVAVGIDPSFAEEKKFRLSMQSLKQVNDCSYIVNRYNWSSGSIYSGYDDANFSGEIDPVTGIYSFYVITDDNDVYLCVKQGKNSLGISIPSTVKPEDITGNMFETDDGYVWKYLYNIGSFEANRYLSSNFMPVQKVDSDTATTPAEIDQVAAQKTAIGGQILSIAIDSGGSGYTTAPTLTIIGDGDSAEASCIINGGKIVDVFMKRSPDSDFNVSYLGTGYRFANVELSSGTASLRPIIARNADGVGADPVSDLKSRGLMFNIKTDGDENDTFIVDQTFRQVGLIQNPARDSSQYAGFTGDSAFTGPSGFALNYLQFQTGATFSSPEGETITDATSGAKAFVDDWNSTTRQMYYHQTAETGFRLFGEGNVVTASNGAGAGTLDSASIDADTRAFEITDIDKFSGDLLYIDNRAAIERDAEQVEDIKVVIQI